jgi:hypothetical protein
MFGFFLGLGALCGFGVLALIGERVNLAAIGICLSVMSINVVAILVRSRFSDRSNEKGVSDSSPGVNVSAISGIPLQTALAKREGRTGLARIDALRPVRSIGADQTIYECEGTIRLLNGAVFRTSQKMLLSSAELQKYQLGTRHVVLSLNGDTTGIVFTGEDPDSLAWQGFEVPPADQAGPLNIVDSVSTYSTVGVNAAEPASAAPVKKSRPWAAYVGYALLLCVGFIAATSQYTDAILQAVAGEQTQGSAARGVEVSVQEDVDLRQPEPLADAIKELEREIGHDSVFSVTVMKDFITVEAPLKPGVKQTDEWMFRYGQVSHEGPKLSQPSEASEQFEMSEVTWSALWPSLETASNMSDLEFNDDTHLSVRRSLKGDWMNMEVYPVVVWFSLRSDYRDVRFDMYADGSDLVMASR